MSITHSATTNIKKLVYAVMTDEALETYGTVKPVSPLINMKIAPSVNAATLYADGYAVENVSAIGDIAVDIETQDMPLELQADFLGHTLDPITGIMEYNNADIPPYIAIGYQRVKANGKSRFVWLLKVKFQELAEEGATQGESVVFQTPKITGVGVCNKSGDWKKVADEDSGTTPTTVAYLDTVPVSA